MTLFKWLWAVVCYHGWWKHNPKDWGEIVKKKDRITQLLPFESLPKKYKKRGTPIHSFRCKICDESGFTSCKEPLCKKLSCWLKYYKRRTYVNVKA